MWIFTVFPVRPVTWSVVYSMDGQCRLLRELCSPGLYSQDLEIATIWGMFDPSITWSAIAVLLPDNSSIIGRSSNSTILSIFHEKASFLNMWLMFKISCGIFCCLNDILLPGWPQSMVMLPLKSMHNLCKISTWPMSFILMTDKLHFF